MRRIGMVVRWTGWAALAAIQALAVSPGYAQQAGTKTASEPELKQLLVWNSPWEGKAQAPGRLYSYRTVFHVRRDAIVAEVISYSTNQRSDSVVDIRDGHLKWQDSSGAEVNVALADGGELIGTATSQNAALPIVLKPRP
jgi:hypothetical protein